VVVSLLEIFFVRLGSAAFFLSGEELAGGRQREHREAAVRAHPDLVPVRAQYIYHSSKDKKTVKIKVFFHFFAC
jgi:hypothetical protein